MADDKYKIYCTIKSVQFAINSRNVYTCFLELKHFKFEEGSGSTIYSDRDRISLSLERDALYNITGLNWNGTKKNVEKIKKDLEGRTVELDFRFKL